MLAVGAVVAVTAASIPAVASGELNGVMLAALALLALGAFEAITPLSQAAAVIDSTDEAAGRIEEVTERPDPVPDPASPAPIPAGGSLRLEDVVFQYPGGEGLLLDQARSRDPARRGGRPDRAQRDRQEHPGRTADPLPRPGRRPGHPRRYRPA